MLRHRVGRVPAVMLAAATLLSGCAVAGTDPQPTRTGLPDDVTVALIQWRSDVATRQAQVEVHNGSEQPIVIGDITVSDPRFAGPATRIIDKRSTVLPGGTVDIRIQLPDLSCDTPEGTSTVALTLVDGDSEDVRTASLPDRLGFLAPLYERECRAEELADAAKVTFASFTPSLPGVPADLALEVVPTGEGGARVAAIQSTNLLSFAGPAVRSYPIDVTMAPGDTAERIVVLPVVPSRCDPHAVLEDKRGTVFNLAIELEGRPGLVQIAADEAMRGRILAWVAEWCEFDKG